MPLVGAYMAIPITQITEPHLATLGEFNGGLSDCIILTSYRPACGTLENAFEFDSLSPNATTYGYCTLMHEDVLPKCTSCVGQGDEFYVTNCRLYFKYNSFPC